MNESNGEVKKSYTWWEFVVYDRNSICVSYDYHEYIMYLFEENIVWLKADNFHAIATNIKPCLFTAVAETQSVTLIPGVLQCQNQFVLSLLMWSAIELE